MQLNSTAPLEMYRPSCGMLPNGNILIASSLTSGYNNVFAVYNVQLDTWVFSATQNYFYSGVLIISIDSRSFVIDHYTVFEFHYNNNTFSKIPFQTLNNWGMLVGQLEVPAGMMNSLQNSCKGI
jgi:hypothetical protein